MKRMVRSIRNTRKMVATLANKLRKVLKNLSKAFRKAWRMVKSGIVYTSAVGVTFRNTQEIIAWLDGMDRSDIYLSLCREPGNLRDRNAIKIYAHVISMEKRACIGYVKKELAAVIAPLMDAGLEVCARLYCITGGYAGLYRGALVDIMF